MNRFEKQPYELFTIATDFGSNFVAGETVQSQTVTAMDSAGGDVTASVTNQVTLANDGGSRVTIVVRAGDASGSPYKLTFRCVTSRGHQWEHDVQMRVREI